jgi:hypothetical protein
MSISAPRPICTGRKASRPRFPRCQGQTPRIHFGQIRSLHRVVVATVVFYTPATVGRFGGTPLRLCEGRGKRYRQFIHARRGLRAVPPNRPPRPSLHCHCRTASKADHFAVEIGPACAVVCGCGVLLIAAVSGVRPIQREHPLAGDKAERRKLRRGDAPVGDDGDAGLHDRYYRHARPRTESRPPKNDTRTSPVTAFGAGTDSNGQLAFDLCL